MYIFPKYRYIQLLKMEKSKKNLQILRLMGNDSRRKTIIFFLLFDFIQYYFGFIGTESNTQRRSFSCKFENYFHENFVKLINDFTKEFTKKWIKILKLFCFEFQQLVENSHHLLSTSARQRRVSPNIPFEPKPKFLKGLHENISKIYIYKIQIQ